MSSDKPLREKPREVYFFGTCLVDLFYPEAGLAGIRLIQREGVEVIFPRNQSCCGQPAFNSGHPEEARAVARAQIALFPKEIPIVLPSGSCAGMMARHYPELFKGDPLEQQALSVARRVRELTQFLAEDLQVDLKDLGAPEKVTWHCSCHAKREMGVGDEPAKLLGQLENVSLQRLEREHECCGFGGTFAVRHPEVSAAMVQDKVSDVEQTGATTLLTGDCGCLMNIAGAMEKQGAAVQGKHIAEYLWERTQ